MCGHEEGRLSMEAGESMHFATKVKNKDQAKGYLPKEKLKRSPSDSFARKRDT